MLEKRTVHVVNIDDFFPELFAITFPTVERWAQKIGARVNLITQRRWPDWPILTEKLQVWYDGADSDWNVLLDADILVHPDTPDMLGTLVQRHQVGVKDSYNADQQLKMDQYFLRDQRRIGVSTCAVVTSRWCHDLWYPLPLEMSREQACAGILQERKIIDEYCVSRNMARYGLEMQAILDPDRDYNRLLHVGSYDQDQNRILELAQRWKKDHWR